jgi:hypothetical protein
LVDVCHGGCGNGVVSILADVWLVPLLVNNFGFFFVWDFGLLGKFKVWIFLPQMYADERG